VSPPTPQQPPQPTSGKQDQADGFGLGNISRNPAPEILRIKKQRSPARIEALPRSPNHHLRLSHRRDPDRVLTPLSGRDRKRHYFPFSRTPSLQNRQPSTKVFEDTTDFSTEAESQQSLLFSATAPPLPIQHAQRPDGISLHTNIPPLTTTPCDGTSIISTTISASSTTFKSGFQRT
jgi:hypothetical protein